MCIVEYIYIYIYIYIYMFHYCELKMYCETETYFHHGLFSHYITSVLISEYWSSIVAVAAVVKDS